jgi:glycosyltransferase involved in cell wall biosynthesis
MKGQPLVSIITPTYNHEKFIRQCIESVLAQTYPHWEQIIIDDDSTDETGEIVAQYKDRRIKYLRQNNLGIWKLSRTYNKALRCSQGELIGILEGDDFWPPYKLEKQIAAFERQEVVLSWGKAAITNSKGRIIMVSPKGLKWFRNRSKEEILKKLLFQNFIPACTVMCRKDALMSIGGFKQPEYAPYIDYPTWLELCLQGNFSSVDEIMGYWRRHERQVSITMRTTMVEAGKYSIDFFRQMPQELRASTGIDINDLLLNHRHQIASAFFLSGRIALTEGKWEEAKKNFREAFDKGSFSTKLEALVGLICGRCRIDLEWVAKIMNIPRLKDMV